MQSENKNLEQEKKEENKDPNIYLTMYRINYYARDWPILPNIFKNYFKFHI